MLAGKKVLIVDDDMRNIFALATVLEEHEMDTISADNGRDAIRMLQTEPDIDIVLMDIMMPEMDGMETMREIRNDRRTARDLPIVAVTAKAMKGDREKCIEAGAWDYLSKPVDTEQMLAVLRDWLPQVNQSSTRAGFRCHGPRANASKILVVDDLPEKLLVYQAILEELGQELVLVRSGEEALKEVLQHDFAVILLDVNMPGMDGFETASLIRRRKKSAHTPIIFVTAFADEVRMAEGYAHGAVDYISTPVVPAILRAKVSVFVDLFRMTQQVREQAEQEIALADERSQRAAAEEANRRLSFLVRAGGIIARSLEKRVIIENILRVLVPEQADRAAFALFERGALDGHHRPGRRAADSKWSAPKGWTRYQNIGEPRASTSS